MTTQEPTTYKRRTVHYKRAVIGGSKQYLQSILEEALGEGGAYELASSRKEQIDPNDPSAGFHLINKSQHYESIFFRAVFTLRARQNPSNYNDGR